jgi:hypothetical protein
MSIRTKTLKFCAAVIATVATLVTASAHAQSFVTTVSQAEIVINGKVLTASQLTELGIIYGSRPKAGNYWYDTKSGLYGAVGYPTSGFMRAGHDFGTLKAGASSGDSLVFINGRRLPQLEVLAWSAVIGEPVMPGKYWLDSQGNAGHQGTPIPIINIFTTQAQRRMAAAGFGGGSASPSQGSRRSILSTYDRTGTAVYGDSGGVVGVITENGSWYPGQ